MQLAAGPCAPRGQRGEKKTFSDFCLWPKYFKRALVPLCLPAWLLQTLLYFLNRTKKKPRRVRERSAGSFHPKGCFADWCHPFPGRSTSLHWESRPHRAMLVKGKNCPSVARWWRPLGGTVPTLHSLSDYLPRKFLLKDGHAPTSVSTAQEPWWV